MRSVAFGYDIFWTISLVALRYVNPSTTGVQMQRFVEASCPAGSIGIADKFALSQIPPNLVHAVVPPKDGRFYQHHGIDWDAVEKVAQESNETGKIRAAHRPSRSNW